MDSDFQNPNTVNGSGTVTGNLTIGTGSAAYTLAPSSTSLAIKDSSGNTQLSIFPSTNGSSILIGAGIRSINGVTTAKGAGEGGFGVPIVVYDSGTATSAATVSLSYTPPATYGTYRVSIATKNTTGTSCICSLAYTDQTGSAIAATSIPAWTLGSIAGVLTMNTAGDNYTLDWTFATDNSGSTVTIKFALSSTTIVYHVIIERLS